MAKPKKVKVEDQAEELVIEDLPEVEASKAPLELKTDVVEINGKQYKQWTDAAGCTFVEPL